MRRQSPPFPEDGIFRAILLVLVLSVVAGAVLALVGEAVYQNQAMSRAGGWIAIVCGLLYFFFRWLGRREAARRAAEKRQRDAWDDFDERSE